MTTKDINFVFNNWIDNILFDIHTILPGKIVNYEGHDTRKAKVQPLIKARNKRNNIIEMKPIDSVPVVFQSTNKFNMLFPLEKDDPCMLFFSEAAIGGYLKSTNINTVDADNATRFSLENCICIPGLWSFKNTPKLSGVNNDDFFLMYENFKIQVKKNTNYFTMTDGNNVIESGASSLKMNNNLEVLI